MRQVCGLAFFAAMLAGSQPLLPPAQESAFVPVVVTGVRDQPVTGLEADNFRVFENGFEQTISYFSSKDDPASVVIVLDTSASRRDRLNRARTAMADFVSSLPPQHEILVIDFSSGVPGAASFTRDKQSAIEQLKHAKAGGPTPLIDAVFLALEKLRTRPAKQRKIILVNSDGDDDTSRHNAIQLEVQIAKSDVVILAMGPAAIPDSAGHRTPLLEFAAWTGGRYVVEDTPSAGRLIAETLKNQYVLGYKPSDAARSGKYRKLRVEVRPPAPGSKMRVSFRPGFYAPE